MKNYIGFRADRIFGRKNGGVIIYIKATEVLNANSYTWKNGILLLLMCTVLQTAQQKNLAAPWMNYEQN